MPWDLGCVHQGKLPGGSQEICASCLRFQTQNTPRVRIGTGKRGENASGTYSKPDLRTLLAREPSNKPILASILQVRKPRLRRVLSSLRSIHHMGEGFNQNVGSGLYIDHRIPLLCREGEEETDPQPSWRKPPWGRGFLVARDTGPASLVRALMGSVSSCRGTHLD